MEIIGVCLQGFITGALVGLPLSPVGLWGVEFRLERNFIGLLAIILGGALGDTAFALLFVQISDLIARVGPWPEVAIYVGGGAILLLLTFRTLRKNEETTSGTTVAAFGLALVSALSVDNIALLSVFSPMLQMSANHLTSLTISFFIGDFIAGALTILGVAYISIKSSASTWIIRGLCFSCVIYGFYLLACQIIA